MIYLDNAATSWPKPEAVYRAMDIFLREHGANPGRAAFRMALAAENVIGETRTLVQKLFNAPSTNRIIFTLNCTDALNMALKGMLEPGDHVITGNLEHNSVSRPLNSLARQGVEYSRVQHLADGTIDPGEIEKIIRPHTKLIVLAHASNVMGTLQPLQEIGELASRHNIFFLVDGAQTAGAVPVDLQAMSIDMLTCPGHKALLGPPGTGLLILGDGVELKAWREGGTGSVSEEPFHPLKYPDRLEGGTPNTIGIAGLKAGVEFILGKGLERIREHELMLLEKLLSGLGKIPGMTIYGSLEATKRVGLVTFNLEGWEPQNLSAVLDAGFELACRSGLHCAPWAHEAINTLPAGAVRFSVSYFNTEAEIDTAVAAVAELANNF